MLPQRSNPARPPRHTTCSTWSQNGFDSAALSAGLLAAVEQGNLSRGASGSASGNALRSTPLPISFSAAESAADKCCQLGWRSYLIAESAALLFLSLWVSLDFASMAVSDLDEISVLYVGYFSSAFISNILLCVASGLEARETFVNFFQALFRMFGCCMPQKSDSRSLRDVDCLIIPAFVISAGFVVPSCYSAFGIALDMQRSSSIGLIKNNPVLSVLSMVLYTMVTRLSGTRGLIGEALEFLYSLCRYYSFSEVCRGHFLSSKGISRALVVKIVTRADCLDNTSLFDKFSTDFSQTFTASGLLRLGFSAAELKRIIDVGKSEFSDQLVMGEKTFFRAGFDQTTLVDERDKLNKWRRVPWKNYLYRLLQVGLLYSTFNLQPFWLAKTKLDNPLLQWLGATASNFFYMRAALNFFPGLSQFELTLEGGGYCWLLLLPFVGVSGISMSNEVAAVTCIGAQAVSNCTVYEGDPAAEAYAASDVGQWFAPDALRKFLPFWTLLVAGVAANGVGAMHLKSKAREIVRDYLLRWNHVPFKDKKVAEPASPWSPGPFGYSSRHARSHNDLSALDEGAGAEAGCPARTSASAPPTPKKSGQVAADALRGDDFCLR